MVGWWHTSIILGLGRQENHEFHTSLGYIVRPCLKNKQINPAENKSKTKKDVSEVS
jgi:hypothetical protein